MYFLITLFYTAFSEVSDISVSTVPPPWIVISPSPKIVSPLIVFILVPLTRVSYLELRAEASALVAKSVVLA
jgi:hypothetical protein